MRRLVPLLLLAIVLSGCTVLKEAEPRPVRGERGVVAESAGDATVVRLGDVIDVRIVRACGGPCDTLETPPGTLVADHAVLSLGNVSVNAIGPDRDSAVHFYDGGQETGRFLRWNDLVSRFQLNADVQAIGNLTATGYVGTTTPLVLEGGQVVTLSTAALEGTEQAVFFRGSGVLMNGTYPLTIPAEMLAIADLGGRVTVQATLTSDGPAIYVAEKGPEGIVFRATGGATPDGVTFDYFIQAPRRGGEGFQL